MNIHVSKFLFVETFFSNFSICREKSSIISWNDKPFSYIIRVKLFSLYRLTSRKSFPSSFFFQSNLTHLPIFILYFLLANFPSVRKSRTIPTIRAHSSSRDILSSSRSLSPEIEGASLTIHEYYNLPLQIQRVSSQTIHRSCFALISHKRDSSFHPFSNFLRISARVYLRMKILRWAGRS